MASFTDYIQFLKGVGTQRAKLLNTELGVYTYEDMLYTFPYKHIDRTKFYKISEIHSALPYIQIRGKILSFESIGPKYKKRLTAKFTDGSGTIEMVWFVGAKWVTKSIKPGVEYIVFGKPNTFGSKINIVHPEMEEASKFDAGIVSSLQAHYHTSEKLKSNYLTSKAINKFQQQILQALNGAIFETLPAYLTKKHKLIPLKDALINIHFPKDLDQLKKAENRLKFEELFYIQLNILKQKKAHKNKFRGFVFPTVGDYFNNFYKNNLPFELTNAQKRVIKEIRVDIGTGRHMNRLLQGDVGSGKTLVALMSMLIAIDNGFQTCIMAPTEILANQHFETINEFTEGLGLNIKLLTGSTKKAARTILHEELLNGSLNILIGTHALIEDTVQYKNLGLVVIDEQHRFGVAQRARMWKKNTLPPHILVMTATPIPRTLAMTVYGDLDVSIIDELPPGRKPIKTVHRFDSKRLEVFGFLKKEIEKGRQIYIVYPLIKESEKMDYKDLEDGYASITKAFPIPEYQVSIVHGKMKAQDKDIEMQRFAEGKTQIMVATTVIEVGVNIPNASVMIIESAERFGLSQLHQLRGRVGRGSDQSYCILMTSYKLSDDGRKRMETMVSTNDGFLIAETDLKLRGPGNIEGTQQSGIPFDLKIANLGKDVQLLQFARNIADEIIEDDPTLEKTENKVLQTQVKKMVKSNINWGAIS